MDKRTGIRRHRQPLSVHARPEHHRHRGVHGGEASRRPRRARRHRWLPVDSVGHRLHPRRRASPARTPAPSPEHPGRAVRYGGRAPDRHRDQDAHAASRPGGRVDLRRTRVRPHGRWQASAPRRSLRAVAAKHWRGRSRTPAGAMNTASAPLALTARLLVLSSISFGGFPIVLPDVRHFVVTTHGWMTDQDFSQFFAIAQSIPGPNMILMMGFVGWKVWGIPGAIVSSMATFGPPCAIYFAAYRLWYRFRGAPWQPTVRNGLVPVTIGLVIASGTVMARAADTGPAAAVMTVAAATLMLSARLNPLWVLLAGGALGGFGLL